MTSSVDRPNHNWNRHLQVVVMVKEEEEEEEERRRRGRRTLSVSSFLSQNADYLKHKQTLVLYT